MEIWKDIKGFEGYYQVSNMGRIKSLERWVIRNKKGRLHVKARIIKGCIETRGYSAVTLTNNGKRTYARIHRLVADAFLNNPFNKPEVNHIDGNKQNNKVSNLEYCTRIENEQHAYKTGLKKGKTVEMIDKDTGMVIAEYPSAVDAISRFTDKKNPTHIYSCLHGRCETAYGYKWKYKNTVETRSKDAKRNC